MIDVNIAAVFAVLGAGALLTVLISAFLGLATRPRGGRGGAAAPGAGFPDGWTDERRPDPERSAALRS
jgi:hypothetical protein